MEKVTNINNFRRALQFTLSWEGGYVNDPDDPGGETKWGISKRSYPHLDIKNLSPEEALEIYHRDYWTSTNCDSYSLPNALVIFDSAVTCGVSRTLRWIEEANASNDTLRLHDALLQLRRAHYYNLVKNTSWAKKYINGWMNRLNKLKKETEILLVDE